jgi:tetratricopeptide (TPR) repeat protein
MDFLQLDNHVMALLRSGRFREAESELQRARLQATDQSDSYTLERVLAELAHLYCLMQPPDFEKAAMYSLERERVTASGQSKLQTAMMYYWSMHDPERAVQKVQQAAAHARNEEDTATVYQCLALLGLALLDLGKSKEAADVLLEMQSIIAARKRIVAGDETLLLERLSAKAGEDTQRVIKSIASTLWPICRDAAFAARLKALANE